MQSNISDLDVAGVVGDLELFGIKNQHVPELSAVDEPQIDALVSHTGLWES